MNSMYRQCVTGGVGGGVEMYYGPYSAGVLQSVSDQIRNLQNCFTAPNKMTSEDDIKGLVSLTSFVHAWVDSCKNNGVKLRIENHSVSKIKFIQLFCYCHFLISTQVLQNNSNITNAYVDCGIALIQVILRVIYMSSMVQW